MADFSEGYQDWLMVDNYVDYLSRLFTELRNLNLQKPKHMNPGVIVMYKMSFTVNLE